MHVTDINRPRQPPALNTRTLPALQKNNNNKAKQKQITFASARRAVHGDDDHLPLLSTGAAAWMETWDFKTAAADTCTSVAGGSVRHESESLCKNVFLLF